MAINDRIRLLDCRLDVTRHLTPAEREELADVWLPAIEVDRGPLQLDRLVRRHRAFAATVLDGMVVQDLQIGGQLGIQLLGPGDALLDATDLLPAWLAQSEYRASGPVRLGLLGSDFLATSQRSPQIIRGLYGCVGDQMQRLSGQLVICQLPRVDQRVLSIMWLLAESWGHVTPGGVRLPLVLTHETLGALIGARRPTVTLALRKLTDEGAIVHQDGGWLLLEDPPMPAVNTAKMLPPEATEASLSVWAAPPPAPDPTDEYAEVRDTVRRLREQQTHDREETRQQLSRIRSARVRMALVRDQIERGALRRRPLPPSS